MKIDVLINQVILLFVFCGVTYGNSGPDLLRLDFNLMNFEKEVINVEGVVTDVNGEPLIGVNVLVKGSDQGTATDFNGKFELSDVADDAILVLSYIGYKTKEVPLDGKASIIITLEENLQTLDELVVVGYGEQKKANLTGAVDQIGSKEIENFSVPNVSRALQGQIPGLNISFNNGRPNSNPTYNIRGLTSIGAGGSALVLIDGVEGDPSTLNPEDVESVSVLKDAASAAIYGSRGAFGVVLITTKDPGEKSQIKYSANFSTNSRTTEREVLKDSYLWAKMYLESFTELYGGTRTPTTVGSVGINFSQDYLDELKYRSENPDHGKQDVGVDPSTGSYAYYGNTDWRDLIYKDNIPSMEHSLVASGGGETSSFYISGRYFTQDGLYNIRSDKYNAYDLRTKGSIQPFNWLRLNSNIHYSSNSYVDPFSNGNVWNTILIRSGATPMGVPYNPDGTYTQIGSQTIGVLEGESQAKNDRSQILGSIAFDASIVKDVFNIQGNFTYRNQIIETNQKYIPVPYSNMPNVITNVGDSRLYNNKNTLNYFVYNLYGNYKHNFRNSKLGVMAGGNMEISNTRFLNVNRSNLIIKELDAFNLATGENFMIEGGGNDWANAGIFTRINYNYDERYLVELNARYDGSSKFPQQEQFGFFPSFSLGWRLSEESILEGTGKWLDNLKLRASYGSLGNSQINPYLYVPQIRASQTNKVIKGERPVVTRNPAVLPDDFTWETSTTLDFGLDADFFKGRLSFVFDWFQRNTKDMITVGPVLPSVFGASSPRGNYADLETKGFEVSLRWRDQLEIDKPLNYSLQLTLSDDVSYITKYNNPQGNLIIDPNLRTAGYYEGMRVGDIWGLTTLGLFADQAEIDDHADQSFILTNVGGQPAKPGDIKFEDINGDGKVDWGDQTISNPGDLSVIGNMSSRYKFGIRLNGEYSGFAISTFFQGVAKRDWYPVHHQNPFWGPYGYWGAEIPIHFLENSYTNDNPDPNAYWPRWKGNMAYGNRQLQPQTRYLQNTAYIRLKELTLSYSPQKLASMAGMSKLSFFFTGNNIWTYSPVFKISKDIDPEQMDDNIGTYYPMLKTYSVGVNIAF
ncbi:SusC/RagA family TonB-linked outer membrane protein [Membranihabitans maritimus]|uniref:SusC/RagA family TonB-linked outer membrane protein n=1 Tax=Membranihabitans maritimus TaxID=2904244 RepID=UPI001F267B68|nr:TonB-dependent receptor [Membranihabitans maritimus]